MSGDLGMMLKEEKCLIGFGQKSHQFVCFKKFIVLKKQITYGKQNGAIKLTSPRMKATKQVYAFSLTIILTFRSKDFIPTLRGDLLSVT